MTSHFHRMAIPLLSLTLLCAVPAHSTQGALKALQAGVSGEQAASRLSAPSPRGAGPVLIVPGDGSFENGYSINTLFFPEFVQRLAMPAASGALVALEVCFVSLDLYLPGELEFDYVVYSVAPGGGPGLELGFLTADNPETLFPLVHTCIAVAIVPFDVGSEIYFGARWDGLFDPDLYISADENGPSAGPAFARRNGLDSTWSQLGGATLFPNYRNLGLGLIWAPAAGIFSDGFESGSTSAWSSAEPTTSP